MRAEDMQEVYGNWSAIEARVADGANRAALLRQLYAELQRRRAGFEGLASDVFRAITGCPEDQKLNDHPLYNSFWGLMPGLLRDGKLKQTGKRSGSAVYRVSAEDEVVPKKPPPASKVSRTEKPKTWRDEAMKAIRELTPSEFEHLVAAWARVVARGEPEVTERSADGGFDVVVSFPLLDSKVRIEAKLWNTSKVGSPVVRKLRGALHLNRGDTGIVVAPGGFSEAALTEARAKGKAKVKLVDGDQLLDDMKEHGLGLKVRMVEKVTVDRDWFRTFKE